MTTVLQQIEKFNSDRDKELLKLKYKRMSENASRFFRGSCHLIYEDISKNEFLLNSPKSWICGDLHLENFGTFTGKDGICYFDINDFDEAMLAPTLWDVFRGLVSIDVFGTDFGLNKKQINAYMVLFYNSYLKEIKDGKSLIIHQQTAKGSVLDLFNKLTDRNKNYLLKSKVNSKNKFFIEDEKTYKLKNEIKLNLKKAMYENPYFKENFKDFKILDIVGRIAGTGSIGIPRYLVLIFLKKSNKLIILDIKQARKSSLEKYNNITQPKWQNEAERICFVQNIMQFQSPNIVESWELLNDCYVVRDYQPTEDKIDLLQIKHKIKDFERLIINYAQLLAWSQIRTSGRKGSDNYEELNKWAINQNITSDLISMADETAIKVRKDFNDFVKNRQIIYKQHFH